MKNIQHDDRRSGLVFCLILGLVSFAFLSVVSLTTTPLITYYKGSDSAFFQLVGQGMTRGLLPYRDFFDMKGLYLFLIEALGQWLAYGRLGIFILQGINLWLSLMLFSRLFSLYGIRKRGIQGVLLAPVLLLAAVTFEFGNLTEEFSLVPLLGCLYLTLGWLRKDRTGGIFREKRFYWIAGGCFGLSFGFFVFVRVTNAALLCAMILTVLVQLIREKQWNSLLVCAGSFVAGLILALLPPVLYCAAHHILDEMLEAVFALGFSYASEKSLLTHMLETLTSPLAAFLLILIAESVMVCVLKWESFMERFLVVAGSVAIFFVISSGNSYVHYFTLALPLIPLGEVCVFSLMQAKPKLKKILLIAGIAVILPCVGVYMAGEVKKAQQKIPVYLAEDETVREIVLQIPEDEKDAVFGYNLDPSWWLRAGMFPCNKYSFWQNHYIALMPKIAGELTAFLDERPPLWLVLPAKQGKQPDFLTNKLDSNYRLFYSNDGYQLYHLDQTPAAEKERV